MSEIKPMLLTEFEFTPDVFSKYADWYFQEKENGIRAIGHVKHGKFTSIRGRRNNPLLHLFPELAELQLGDFDAIIDGELCVFDSTGRSVFYGGINQRDKKLHVENVKKFNATFVAFDVLYLKGQVVVDKPYSERLSLLKGVCQSDTALQTFRVVQNIANPKEYWETRVVAENREGLVIKNPAGHYEVDTRSKNNLKLKNYKTTEVVIDKTEQNNAGIKIYGRSVINGQDIEVECQFSGKNIDVKVGEKVPVVYLDIVGNKLVQPHKVKGYGLE